MQLKAILYISILFLMLPLVGKTQEESNSKNKFRIGLTTGMGYTLTQFEKATQLNFNAAIRTEWQLSKKLSLRIEPGIVYTGLKKYETSWNAFDCHICYEIDYAEHNALIVPIPIAVKYNLNEDNTWYLFGGISPYFYSLTKRVAIFPDPKEGEIRIPEIGGKVSMKHIPFLGFDSPDKNRLLNFHIGFGKEYKISDKYILQIEIRNTYYLNYIGFYKDNLLLTTFNVALLRE
jgi:hypothetical protein